MGGTRLQPATAAPGQAGGRVLAAFLNEHWPDGAPQGDVVEASGSRLERRRGVWTTATIDLGSGVRFGIAGAQFWVDAPGAMPDVVAMASAGRKVEDLVAHRWLNMSQASITHIEQRDGRLRIWLEDGRN